MGQGLLRPLAQVCERDGGAGFEDDGCDDVFTGLPGGYTNRRNIHNARH